MAIHLWYIPYFLARNFLIHFEQFAAVRDRAPSERARPTILQLHLILDTSITLNLAKTFSYTFYIFTRHGAFLALALTTSVHFSHTNSKLETPN